MGREKRPPRRVATADQITAFREACRSDDIEPLERFIDRLIVPDYILRYGLGHAIEHNCINVIRRLLERGVSFEDEGLAMALRRGSIPILEMLREFGWADANKVVFESSNRTPLK
jgi:hypothetical protein